MDAVDPELTKAAATTMGQTPSVIAVEHVRLRWVGHRITADAGIKVDATLALTAAHDIAHAAEQRLLERVPKLNDATIHVSPATTSNPTSSLSPVSPADTVQDHHGHPR